MVAQPPRVRMPYPQGSAGPQPPTAPLTHPLLRIVLGEPRHEVQPVLWRDPQAPQPTYLTLEASLADLATTVELPTGDDVAAASRWLDFSLPADGSLRNDFLTFTVTATFPEKLAPSVLRAVIVLEDFANGKGLLRRPLLSAAGTPVATLTLDYLCITHYYKPVRFSQEKQTFVPRFTGHRGMGGSGPKAPWRLLENSVESFLQAALPDTACKTVELDVQLTRDHSTVVYHDWFFRPRCASGAPVYDADAVRLPVHSLTFRQFDDLLRQSYGHWERDDARGGGAERRAYLRKLAGARGVPADAFTVRARTLREVCEALPADVGLTVELKNPAPAEDGGVDVPHPELNAYIDLVLDELYAVATNAQRNIALLSFDADVALMLSLKQQRWPVYLSHCAGMDKPCDERDPRVVDLGEGHRFVRATGLDGVMMLNELMDMFPKQLSDLVADGVPVLTYGKRNCDVEYVVRQFESGINGVIADDVDEIVKRVEQRKEMRTDCG